MNDINYQKKFAKHITFLYTYELDWEPTFKKRKQWTVLTKFKMAIGNGIGMYMVVFYRAKKSTFNPKIAITDGYAHARDLNFVIYKCDAVIHLCVCISILTNLSTKSRLEWICLKGQKVQHWFSIFWSIFYAIVV